MSFSKEFLSESVAVIDAIDTDLIEDVAHGLAALRERQGRLFILGMGGSAGHASHAVNDFRKICDIESYAPLFGKDFDDYSLETVKMFDNDARAAGYEL